MASAIFSTKDILAAKDFSKVFEYPANTDFSGASAELQNVWNNSFLSVDTTLRAFPAPVTITSDVSANLPGGYTMYDLDEGRARLDPENGIYDGARGS